MEMGTGKTLVAIAAASILYQFGRVSKVLVVTPLTLLGVWEKEIRRFAKVSVNVVVLKGTQEKKHEQLKITDSDKLNFVIVNYESAWQLESEPLGAGFQLVIADEAHKIKECRTKQSKTLHKLGDNAEYKLLLTGTLVTNKEIDVWSQYRFLNQHVFGSSFYNFRNHYFDMRGYGNHTPVFRKSRTEEFLQRLHSVAYRVTKA